MKHGGGGSVVTMMILQTLSHSSDLNPVEMDLIKYKIKCKETNK